MINSSKGRDAEPDRTVGRAPTVRAFQLMLDNAQSRLKSSCSMTAARFQPLGGLILNLSYLSEV